MPDWFTRLRDLVWTSLGAVVCLGFSLLVALFSPERLSLTLSLGLAGVTLGLLAQRE
jgi:hypothetical protein